MDMVPFLDLDETVEVDEKKKANVKTVKNHGDSTETGTNAREVDTLARDSTEQELVQRIQDAEAENLEGSQMTDKKPEIRRLRQMSNETFVDIE